MAEITKGNGKHSDDGKKNTSPFEDVSGNERMILRAALHDPQTTQASIARELGITQQAVSRLVSGLVSRGMIKLGAPVSKGRRGKPGAALDIVPEFAYTFGVSIMADAVAVGIMDFAGRLIESEQVHMETMAQDTVLAKTKDLMNELKGTHITDTDRIFGIGVGMSGYFMDDGMRFNPPAMMKEWALVDVEKIFRTHFDMPVWADNDGNVAAIGESMVGVGRRINNFAYLYFSSGFGGGVIIDGKLMRGENGNTGEFAGILPYNIYAHPNLEFLRQILMKNGVPIDSVHQIVTEFDPEWPGVQEWVSKVRDSLSLVASSISAVLDTNSIVLGGRLPKALAEILIPNIEFYSMPRWGERRPVPKIIASEAKGDATLIGAASLPFSKHFF